MGIENMRRWPMCIVFATCVLLVLALISNWSLETELRQKMAEMGTQLQECSIQQSTCMKESLTLLEQRDGYVTKINEMDKQKTKLLDEVSDCKSKLQKSDTQVKKSVDKARGDVEICKTELQSLKDLQVSKSVVLETLRLDKDTLNKQLTERKQKIEELEKEVKRLKLALTTKSASVPPASSKVTPAAQPPKLSPALNVQDPINEPVLENDAKEEIEDANALNENIDFDPQIHD